MTCQRVVVVVAQPTPAIVTREGATRTVTRTDTGRAVVRDADSRVNVQRDPNNVVEIDQPVVRIVDVVARGPQGPRGAPGGSIAPINFAWGDAEGVVWTPDVPGLLAGARVIIDQVFNGVGATLELGTATDPDAALPASFTALSLPYEYSYTPDLPLAAGEALRLRITPGAGASQGSGTLLLTFLPY